MELILDNNILFSLMNPSSTNSYLFFSFSNSFNFIAPEIIKEELLKYKEICLQKSKLSEQEFEMRQKEVEESIKFISLNEYKTFLKEAINALGDPKDSPYLALSLSHKKSPIWSNDAHLMKQQIVKVFSTKELIDFLINNKI